MDSFDVIANLVFNAPLLTREDRIKNFMRQNALEINRYGKEIQDAVMDVLDKYKGSGEENLSSQIFILPNMNAKKEAIQSSYPNGLFGFVSFIKEKIYSII